MNYRAFLMRLNLLVFILLTLLRIPRPPRSTDFFFSHENIYFTLSGYYYPFDTYLFPIS